MWDDVAVPITTGRLVASSLEKWIYNSAGNHHDGFVFSLLKLAVLNPDAFHYGKSRYARSLALPRFKSPEDLEEASEMLDRFKDLDANDVESLQALIVF